MSENQSVEYKQTWRDEWLKWLCCFANSNGGRLLIGVNDSGEVIGIEDSKKLMEDIPNKIVATLGIVPSVVLSEEGGKEYIEISVEASPVPIAYKGVYHVRSGSTKQELKGGPALQQFLFSRMGLSWDDVSQTRASLSDLDPAAISYFQRVSIMNGRMNADSLTEDPIVTLNNLNLTDEEGRLKNAAILLFGKNPSRFFPLCDFRIGRFGEREDDLLFQDVIEGDLIRMADRVIDVLRAKYLISPIHYEGLRRIEPMEIPEEALREAIFNAIIHRDYTGAHIQMKVFDDRVELWNDGSLPDGWTTETLLSQHYSKPRNRNIATAFYKAGFIESWGRGISKMIHCVEEAQMQAPQFSQVGSGILVSFSRLGQKKPSISRGNTTADMLLSEKIVHLIASDPTLSISNIALKLGVTVFIVRKTIQQMKERGEIFHSGSKRSGRWVLPKT